MKILGALAVFALSFSQSSFADDAVLFRTFSCKSVENFRVGDFVVKTHIEGDLERDEEGRYALLEYAFGYEIILEGNQWDKYEGPAQREDSRVMNDENYNPNKYKGHVRFALSKHIPMGHLDFIVPKKAVKNENKFSAYFVMTHIQDHFGTTVPMVCK